MSSSVSINESYVSQWGQDKFLNEKVFCGKKNGVFVDVGAHDGKTISNTYFFEKYLNWTGICIEPILERYVELVKNRNCICHHCCVYNKNGTVKFMENTGYSEMLSGIKDTYDVRHKYRLEKEQKLFGGKTMVIEKPAYTLSTLLRINNIKNVDLLSVDTEGSEFEVLQGLDFNEHNVTVITVENNYPDTFYRVDDLLTKNNYEKIESISGDEVYIKIN